ncbi:MAG: HNH endonuclease [Merdibacter sp.]
MIDDYRNTVYCPQYSDIGDKKKKLVEEIRKKHPRANDMHAIIHPNDGVYKDDFMNIYNHKCAYCGVSIDVISRTDFEVDHYIYEKSKRFPSKADAGYIENLILACHDCNHDKSSFEFPDEKYKDLYPDEEEIKKTFIRDDDYYIKVSDEKNSDTIVKEFYEKLHLGSEIHRIDYLLMSMMGVLEKIEDKPEVSSLLGQAVKKLHTKRNIMRKNV